MAAEAPIAPAAPKAPEAQKKPEGSKVPKEQQTREVGQIATSILEKRGKELHEKFRREGKGAFSSDTANKEIHNLYLLGNEVAGANYRSETDPNGMDVISDGKPIKVVLKDSPIPQVVSFIQGFDGENFNCIVNGASKSVPRDELIRGQLAAVGDVISSSSQFSPAEQTVMKIFIDTARRQSDTRAGMTSEAVDQVITQAAESQGMVTVDTVRSFVNAQQLESGQKAELLEGVSAETNIVNPGEIVGVMQKLNEMKPEDQRWPQGTIEAVQDYFKDVEVYSMPENISRNMVAAIRSGNMDNVTKVVLESKAVAENRNTDAMEQEIYKAQVQVLEQKIAKLKKDKKERSIPDERLLFLLKVAQKAKGKWGSMIRTEAMEWLIARDNPQNPDERLVMIHNKLAGPAKANLSEFGNLLDVAEQNGELRPGVAKQLRGLAGEKGFSHMISAGALLTETGLKGETVQKMAEMVFGETPDEELQSLVRDILIDKNLLEKYGPKAKKGALLMIILAAMGGVAVVKDAATGKH